jgi:gas vesicle protein
MKLKGKIALGGLLVLGTGIVTGLLIAPRKGKKTRKILKGAVTDCINLIKDTLSKGERGAEDVQEKSLDIVH